MNRPLVFAAFLSCVLSLAPIGCVHGDRGKGGLKDLNGLKAPNQSNAMTGFFSRDIDQNKTTTIIVGTVTSGAGIEQVPARGAIVQVLDGDKVKLETKADNNGNYLLRGNLPNSSYQIKAVFDRKTKTQNFTADSYVLEHMDILIN